MKLTKSKKSEATRKAFLGPEPSHPELDELLENARKNQQAAHGKARAVETRRILRQLIADLNDENGTNDLTVWVILRQLCRTYRPDYVRTILDGVIDNETF